MSTRDWRDDRALARAIPSVHESQNRVEAQQARTLVDVAVHDFGEGFLGSCCAAHPNSEALNALTGWKPGDVARLDQAVEWVRSVGGGAHLRVEGAETNVETHALLVARGFQVTEIEVWLWGRAEEMAQGAVAADIRAARSAEDLSVWARTGCDGWGVDEGFRPVWAASIAPHPAPENWSHLIAYRDGEPGGTALLTMEAHAGMSIGYLADASVMPSHRGYGLQRDLIIARAALAKEKGAELMFAGARWGSASHRNMERSGLSVAEVCTLWRYAPGA